MRKTLNRRAFHSSALGLAAIAMPAAARVVGANERVRLGCIGVGNRGVQLLNAFCAHDDARVVALADVYAPYLNNEYGRIDPRFKALGGRIPKGQPDFGSSVERHADFRRLLDRKDIDAVIIATPDHWHAIQTILACDAGKDVYVEKPLSVAVAEGRRMVQAARRGNRVVQVGTQRRSSPLYAELANRVRDGALGKVCVARAAYASNMAPTGIGKVADSTPPEGLDWDMWLGPRPMRPFNQNIMPYKFRWWEGYSSQMANWGVHYFDAMRWMVGEEAPLAVSAHGGQFAVDDDRTIPDTAEVIFELPSKMLMCFSLYESNGAPVLKGGEVELRGTLATVHADHRRYEAIPERGGQFQDPAPRSKAFSGQSDQSDTDLDRLHARNFLDCVKSRATPNADIEVGHRSTTFALLANLSLALRARLEWDAAAERVTNNDEANRLLDYEYRSPWNGA